MKSWSWSRSGYGFWLHVNVTSPHAVDVVFQCVSTSVRVSVDIFRQNGLCISTLVSPLSPLFYPHHSLSSCCSLRAAEGRQRSLHALDCLLHCLCCFCVPVPRSLPIFVFINHNGRLLWVSWWLFLLFCVAFCSVAQVFVFRHRLSVLHLCHCVNGHG